MTVKCVGIFLLGAALLLSGCSSLITESNAKTIGVNYSEPNRIQFQGKGAGAGFALMSTMGSMGVALGVAIDEGIAKEIREAAYAAGFSIDDSISQGVQIASNGTYRVGDEKEASPITIRIKRYGFHARGGKDDQTFAEIEVEVSQDNKEAFAIHYPKNFREQVGFEVKTYPLNELKKNGALSKSLLDKALVAIFDRVF